MERIAKRIASSGFCSRRDAESLVFSGKVKVNGFLIQQASVKVMPDDVIEIDGKIIKSNITPKIYLYNKPVGIITTTKDPNNRETIFQNIKKQCINIEDRLIYIGRLDINSSGLLLLTNTPSIAAFLEKGNFERVYKVRISGILSEQQIKKIKHGLTINGIKYFGVKDIKYINLNNKNCKNHWIEITLTEGKNREIRKIMNYFGLHVSKLIRIKYYKYELKNLASGKIIEASKKSVKELINLINQ